MNSALIVFFVLLFIVPIATLLYISYERRQRNREKRQFGCPPGPDVYPGDLVVAESPPDDGWHPIFMHLPVEALFKLSQFDGQFGLVVAEAPPLKVFTSYDDIRLNLPKTVNAVDILDQNGKVYYRVPVLTLHVVARKN